MLTVLKPIFSTGCDSRDSKGTRLEGKALVERVCRDILQIFKKRREQGLQLVAATAVMPFRVRRTALGFWR